MKKLLAISLVTFTFSLFTPGDAQSFNTPEWDSLASGTAGPNHNVRALVMADSSYTAPLYAGGDFIMAGGIASQHIAEWNGFNAWDSMGSGVNNTVYALAMYNNKLYAGGSFDTAGRIACSRIASWDSVSWDSLSGSINGSVYALCVYNNALYVGGNFTMVNGIKVNGIAKWNGTSWDSVGSGFDSNSVYALVVYNDTLYAGGSFVTVNGVHVNHIAKWTGTKWDSLQGGTNNTVYALANYYGVLYAGGAFTASGKIKTNFISSWDSAGWDSLGSGTNDTVLALNVASFLIVTKVKQVNVTYYPFDIFLLVGGHFTNAGGVSTHNLAGYGQTLKDDIWSYVGETNGPVYSIANTYNFDYNCYIGGTFDTAYDSPPFGFQRIRTNYVAQLQLSSGSGIPAITDNSDVNVFPNPTNGKFTVEMKNEELRMKNPGINSGQVIEVYNVLGEQVYSQFLTPNSQFLIDLSGQPNGIYLYRVIDADGDLIGEGKIIVQK